MKYAVALLFILTACGAEPQPEPAPVLGFVGSYGVRYLDEGKADAYDAVVVATAEALANVYTNFDAEKAFERVTVAEGELPEGIDGATDHAGNVTLKPHACAGNGSLAHELAHLTALRLTGDGDSGHHNTKLFMDDCKTNACVWASVEMVGRPLCQ